MTSNLLRRTMNTVGENKGHSYNHMITYYLIIFYLLNLFYLVNTLLTSSCNISEHFSCWFSSLLCWVPPCWQCLQCWPHHSPHLPSTHISTAIKTTQTLARTVYISYSYRPAGIHCSLALLEREGGGSRALGRYSGQGQVSHYDGVICYTQGGR